MTDSKTWIQESMAANEWKYEVSEMEENYFGRQEH